MRKGRHRADLRKVFDGIIFRLRSGCQWNKMYRNRLFGHKIRLRRLIS
jgi:transposase